MNVRKLKRHHCPASGMTIAGEDEFTESYDEGTDGSVELRAKRGNRSHTDPVAEMFRPLREERVSRWADRGERIAAG
jgi:hypothetical protein